MRSNLHPSRGTARHQLGRSIGWGGSAPTEPSHGVPTDLTTLLGFYYYFSIVRVAGSPGICLALPSAHHFSLPIPLAFFGASFSCTFTHISSSNEQEFLGIMFHFRGCSPFEAIPPLPYLCTVSS